MRVFKTIDELWSFCLYCPICQQPSRTVTLTVGPDDEFKLTEYQKVGSELKLFCSYRHDSKYRRSRAWSYSAVFNVDCTNNTYTVQGSGSDLALAKKVEDAYFFCYLHGKCHGCYRTYLNSSDLEFNAADKTISNIRMDQEAAYLLSEKDKFHINLSHDRNVMMVSRCEEMGEAMIDDPRIIELPLVNLDFSNAPKVINKIKTLILFS